MNKLRTILLVLTAVAALSVVYPAKANLITNPGFETGDLTGWTAANSAVVVGAFNGVAPHSGNFQASLTGNTGIGGSITQNVTTTPGGSYVVDFWVAGALTPGRNMFNGEFIVQWGGSTVFGHFFSSAFGYTEYTLNLTASSTTTALLFAGNTFPGVFLLDDISVNPAGVGVPDAGSTLPLLGCALLGLAALRRKLGC